MDGTVMMLLMDNILHQLIHALSLSHEVQGSIYPVVLDFVHQQEV